ncbi:MAG: DUF1631 domain-containing protein [Sedimenticola sp.]|nr:DUF1631 domain-containing protein [Sedimenticola sp.]
MKAGNVISFGDKRQGEQRVTLREGYQGTINACRQLLVKGLPKMMDSLFERLDDVLYDQADKSVSDQQQADYFEAMRCLRRDREQVESSFNKELLGRFDRFWVHGSGAPSGELTGEITSDEMGLVESDDLEEGLAITGMISKGNNTFYRDLYALDQRFSYLMNGARIEEDGNPLAPVAICEAFRQAVTGIAVNLPVKLVIYKQFEKEVFSRLGPLYDQINAVLAKAGVQPGIKPTVRRNSPYQGASATTTGRREEGGGAADEAGQARELFSTLQQLLRSQRPAPPVYDPELPVQTVDSGDLLSALSAMQHQHTGSGAVEVMDAGTLRSVVLQMPQLGASNDANRALGRADDDTIDVIAMLFEFILDDPGLTDGMRALLARLQIPMLKVAILDKSFFGRKDHPARRLLNSMAQAAIGWTESSGRSGDGLYAQIESLVGRILNEFDDNLELFDELQGQFSAYLEREQRAVQVAEERAAQVTQGKEALVEAKRYVAEEIGRCLSIYDAVPDVAQNLVRDAWNDVLLLIYLRKGRESEEWVEAVKLMERLVWSVMPKPSQRERQELLRAIPELLKGLRSGLSDISYNQHKMTRAFKSLQARHLACLRGGRAVTESDGRSGSDSGSSSHGAGVMEEIVLESGGDVRARPEASADAGAVPSDEFDRLGDELSVGQWIELTREDGETLRAKLSWRSAVTGTCLFVNRKGLKVAEVSGTGLAEWMRNGKAKLLPQPDNPLMDRALNSMVNELNDSASTTEGRESTDPR